MRQKLVSSCGPVALMNAVKWAGYSLNREGYLAHYSSLCKFVAGRGGTYCDKLEEAIVATPELALVEFLDRPTLRELDQALKKGYSIILRYRHDVCGHFIFIPKRTAKFYYVVNGGRSRPTLTRISRKTVSSYLRYSDDAGNTSMTWIVEGV